MKTNKKRIAIISAILILASVFAVFALQSFISTDEAAKSQEVEALKELIIRESDIKHSLGKYQATNEKYRISDFTEEEKQAIIDDYDEQLHSVYSLKSSQIPNLLEIEEKIFTNNESNFESVLENGVFSIKVNDAEITGDSAEIDVTMYTWQKYVKEIGDGQFKAIFPVTHEEHVYNAEKIDGEWKIISSTMYTYDFDGDCDKEQTFDNVEDAIEYANSVEVKNILN